MEGSTKGRRSGEVCCSPSNAKCLCFNPYKALALSNAMFMVLLVGFLVDRGWRGNIMAISNCGTFLPDICLISDCINGIYDGLVGYGVPLHVFVQSVIWVGVSIVAVCSAMWLVATVRPLRRWDVFVSLASCSFLFIGLIPDLLPGEWIVVHVGVAAFGLSSGFITTFSLAWPFPFYATGGYVFWYLAVSLWLVRCGAKATRVFDWVSLIQGEVLDGTLTPVILEWVGALGACGTSILYCLQESDHAEFCARNLVECEDSATALGAASRPLLHCPACPA